MKPFVPSDWDGSMKILLSRNKIYEMCAISRPPSIMNVMSLHSHKKIMKPFAFAKPQNSFETGVYIEQS